MRTNAARRADAIRGRAATIEASWRRHGGHAPGCATCITTEYPGQPCDCLCDTCVSAQQHSQLAARADSYARDAAKFRDAGRLGAPILSAEEDAHWARVYQAIADELRNIAAGARTVTTQGRS